MGNTRFFGRDEDQKQPNPTVAKQYAPGTQLPYDPGLPGRLRQQSREILELLENVIVTTSDGKFKHVEQLLLEFHYSYQNHRYEKNQRFIPYMNRCLAHDGGHSELILKINSATRRLDQRVIATIGKHLENRVTEKTCRGFIQELQQIFSDLKRHMREEDEFIYPMYQPPETYRYS